MPKITHGDWVELKREGRRDLVTFGDIKRFTGQAGLKAVADSAEITARRTLFRRRLKYLRLDHHRPDEQASPQD